MPFLNHRSRSNSPVVPRPRQLPATDRHFSHTRLMTIIQAKGDRWSVLDRYGVRPERQPG